MLGELQDRRQTCKPVANIFLPTTDGTFYLQRGNIRIIYSRLQVSWEQRVYILWFFAMMPESSEMPSGIEKKSIFWLSESLTGIPQTLATIRVKWHLPVYVGELRALLSLRFFKISQFTVHIEE